MRKLQVVASIISPGIVSMSPFSPEQGGLIHNTFFLSEDPLNLRSFSRRKQRVTGTLLDFTWLEQMVSLVAFRVHLFRKQ